MLRNGIEADGITLEDLEHPVVRYGDHVVTAGFIAGCDGDRGVSRTAPSPTAPSPGTPANTATPG